MKYFRLVLVLSLSAICFLVLFKLLPTEARMGFAPRIDTSSMPPQTREAGAAKQESQDAASPATLQAKVCSFDLDSKADLAVFRPCDGKWYVRESASQMDKDYAFGTSTDIIVPGDYDNDGRTNLAFWRVEPSTAGRFYVVPDPPISPTPTFNTTPWGFVGDKPVPGDYDGGGADFVVLRSCAMSVDWHLSAAPLFFNFGFPIDRVVPRDYDDNDDKTDITVWRPLDGTWHWRDSMVPNNIHSLAWGLPGDIPLLGDFEGDSIDDFAVFRKGVWYVLLSSGPSFVMTFGDCTDIPVPADYDGDGKTDIAVFRPCGAMWYIRNSGTGVIQSIQFGQFGDIPIASLYVK